MSFDYACQAILIGDDGIRVILYASFGVSEVLRGGIGITLSSVAMAEEVRSVECSLAAIEIVQFANYA